MNTKQIIDEASLLPLEDRAFVIDSLLRTLNQSESENEKKWIHETKKRLTDLRSGSVQAIPGTDVFGRIWKRFEK